MPRSPTPALPALQLRADQVLPSTLFLPHYAPTLRPQPVAMNDVSVPTGSALTIYESGRPFASGCSVWVAAACQGWRPRDVSTAINTANIC